MSPAAKPPDESTYSGRFAARLRMLREKAGLSVEQVVAKMEKAGYPLAASKYYHWESARSKVDLDAIPFLRKSLGVATIAELLPQK